MKIAIFGDLSHVRSFGAQLTSECLRADALHYFKSGNEIKFFPMPSVGIGKGITGPETLTTQEGVRKTIRNIRANNAHTTSKKHI